MRRRRDTSNRQRNVSGARLPILKFQLFPCVFVSLSSMYLVLYTRSRPATYNASVVQGYLHLRQNHPHPLEAPTCENNTRYRSERAGRACRDACSIIDTRSWATHTFLSLPGGIDRVFVARRSSGVLHDVERSTRVYCFGGWTPPRLQKPQPTDCCGCVSGASRRPSATKGVERCNRCCDGAGTARPRPSRTSEGTKTAAAVTPSADGTCAKRCQCFYLRVSFWPCAPAGVFKSRSRASAFLTN